MIYPYHLGMTMSFKIFGKVGDSFTGKFKQLKEALALAKITKGRPQNYRVRRIILHAHHPASPGGAFVKE